MDVLAKILIIEDEPTIGSILRELLTSAGYEAVVAADGLAGIRAFRADAYDLVLLDIMLPKLDGYAVAAKIRQTSATPIIMVTALDNEQAEIKAFEMKADDYITKPFSLKLVLMRVEAVLRRSVADSQDEAAVIHYRSLRLDPVARQVFLAGEEIALTRTEYDLLHLFLRHPGRVFTRDNLISIVWGYDFIAHEKAVNIHIMNLRHKTGLEQIETVRGVGYRLARAD